ncbi:MAG: SoxR reducing system RseC family protein [Bacteroidales bacterium]|jgi:sigma-E factor negative regulatory protein RseC
MKTDNIEHEGVILDIDRDFISVEIMNKAACASCNAKQLCSMSEVKAKVIQVENRGFTLFEKGEVVNVLLKRSLGFKALWISYLIPLIILLVLLLALSAVGVGELLIGLSILAFLALYYFVVYLLRDKIKKEFIFIVEKLDK